MKRVLRIRGCIYFDSDKWTEKEILELLRKKVGIYSLIVSSNMSLKECPDNFKPRQKVLNGFLKLFKKE